MTLHRIQIGGVWVSFLVWMDGGTLATDSLHASQHGARRPELWSLPSLEEARTTYPTREGCREVVRADPDDFWSRGGRA
jgi:hypothetical protein